MEVQELSMYAHDEGTPIQEEEFSDITFVVRLESAITLIVDYHDIVDEAYAQREAANNTLQTMQLYEDYFARPPNEPMIVQADKLNKNKILTLLSSPSLSEIYKVMLMIMGTS